VSIIQSLFLHELTYELALPPSLRQALADNNSTPYDETCDIGLEGCDDERISVSEDDGEYDNIISDLRGGRGGRGIQYAVYFSVVFT